MKAEDVKKGMRVRLVWSRPGDPPVGTLGTVLEGAPAPYVQWDGWTGGHSYGGPTAPNSAYSVMTCQIEPVEEVATTVPLDTPEPGEDRIGSATLTKPAPDDRLYQLALDQIREHDARTLEHRATLAARAMREALDGVLRGGT